MRMKKGVITIGLRTELLIALNVADKVWEKHGQELVITSLNDGLHSHTSLHYSGCGADLRIRYFDKDQIEAVADHLRAALGHSVDYDVVVEDDHIHLEYQPKRRTL